MAKIYISNGLKGLKSENRIIRSIFSSISDFSGSIDIELDDITTKQDLDGKYLMAILYGDYVELVTPENNYWTSNTEEDLKEMLGKLYDNQTPNISDFDIVLSESDILWKILH